MNRLALAATLLAASLLSACDMLGIESPEKLAAARDAEGRAIGGACRYSGRAIEDCYGLNKRADKAAMFAGWREMNDYMRENKMEAVAPAATTQVAAAKPETKADTGDDAPVAKKPRPAKEAKPAKEASERGT
jgi:hypothetical protein